MLSTTCLRLFCLVCLSACAEQARLPVLAGSGPDPALPAPETRLLPTVNVATASGWPTGAAPTAAAGLQVQAFARGLEHPRWLLVLPNGDVLVAETDAPPKASQQEDAGLWKRIKGWVMQKQMQKAGSHKPSPNRIRLLRDSDGDGIADEYHVFARDLNSPFGMALVGPRLYVANTDAIVSFAYSDGQIRVDGTPQRLVDLPANAPNHHWTKNLIASRDGKQLYAAIGSNSNIGENGMDKEVARAAVWQIDLDSGKHRIYASGLRNPVGMAWEPDSGRLWVAVNERDELGSDLVPDYMTALQDDGFYGWPYSYFGQHVDTRVEPPRPDLVARALKPDYALGPHTASLGLCNATGSRLPGFDKGLFVGQHGSWNRKPFSGYKVIFVPFAAGWPTGQPRDVLTGFVSSDGRALGRPVGVAIDRQGALLVADDVGNVIWRVSAAAATDSKANAAAAP